jgi:hypothetical protein
MSLLDDLKQQPERIARKGSNLPAGLLSPLPERVEAWLESVQANLIALEEASALKHNASKRLTHARQALEETTAELYGENAIIGTNKEQRDACLHRLTAAERYEVREAEDAHAVAVAAFESVERRLKRDREERAALEMLTSLTVGVTK